MKRVTVAVLLLAVVGVAACGDEKPAPPTVEVPEWAKVAHEQIAEAKKHGVPVAFENDLGMRFVLIPAGTFLMGSPVDEEGRIEDETQREVTLTRPFYMQITEVTNAQYRAYKPDHRTGLRSIWGDRLESDQQPAGGMTWEDATAFGAWLSSNTRRYDLPSEGEWERACRAGTTTRYACGDTIRADQATFDINFTGTLPAHHWPHQRRAPPSKFSLPERDEAGPQTRVTATVGAHAPNPWGLYDMHGNVAEWCRDSYAGFPPGKTPDASEPYGQGHAIRGGWFCSNVAGVRSAWRGWRPTSGTDVGTGFRLVSPLPERGK